MSLRRRLYFGREAESPLMSDEEFEELFERHQNWYTHTGSALGQRAEDDAVQLAQQVLFELDPKDELRVEVSDRKDLTPASDAPAPRRSSSIGPGSASRAVSALLPSDQGQEWLDEARDHLASAMEEGEYAQTTRLSLFVGLLLTVPVAWYGEVRRRVLRRA